MNSRFAIVGIALLGLVFLASGCSGGGRRTSGAVVGVAPLTEVEFDRFATRIADRAVQVLRLRGDTESVRIAAPTLATGSVEPAETARPFAANLGEALNDRLIGVARVVPSGGSIAPADAADPELAAALEEGEPTPPLRSTLSFSTVASAADGRPAEHVVSFALVDARDGSELFRESCAYAASASPRRGTQAAGRAPRVAAAAPAPTEDNLGEPPADNRAVPRAQPRAAPAAPPIEKAETDEPPLPQLAPEAGSPRTDAGGAQPLRRVSPPPDTPRDERDLDSPPREMPPAKRAKIRIDRKEAGLAKFLQEQLPLQRERVVPGGDGSVLFVDDAAWRRFRLLEQRSLRTADGRLRVELDVRARDKRRNAKVRIVFLDEADRQTEASPVIPERFLGEYTRTVLFAATDGRSAHYIVLFADD